MAESTPLPFVPMPPSAPASAPSTTGQARAEAAPTARARLLPLAAPATAVVLALWLTEGMWRGGPPAGDDTIAHLIRAEYAIEHLVGRGRLDGWQTSFALGYQQFLFIGPVLSWAVAAVQAVSLGTLSTVTAFKVVVVTAFAAVPLATVYLARSLGLSRRAAGLAAVLVLAVNSPFGGIGLSGAFATGLTVNLAGAAPACLAVGAVIRLVRQPTARRAVVAGASTALLAATHGVSMILVAVLVPVLLVLVALDEGVPALWRAVRAGGDRLRTMVVSVRRGAAWVAVAGAVGGGLAAFVLVPLAVHRDLRGPLTGWAHTPLGQRLVDVWHGRILLQPGVAKWLLVGVVYGAWRVASRRPGGLAVLLGPFAFLAVGDLLFEWSPQNVVSQQVPNRGLGYAGLLAVLPLAALLARATRRLGVVGDAAGLAAAVGLVLVPLGSLRDVAQPVRPTTVALEAAAQVRRHVPESGRYAMQRDFPAEIATFGMSHPDFWMAWRSGRNTLNVFNVESSTTPGPAYAPDAIGRQPADQLADAFARYGVSHVLLVDTTKAGDMLASPRYRLQWQDGRVALLEVVPAAGQPSPTALLASPAPFSATLRSWSPEHVVVDATATAATSATAAIAWSPKWHATVDGRPAELRRSSEGLLELDLPAGRSTVELAFRRDRADRAGAAATSLTLVALAARWWRIRQGSKSRLRSTRALWSR